MKSTKVSVDLELWCNCPECGGLIDLVDQDDEQSYSQSIFSDNWDDLKTFDYMCPHCKVDFKVDEIEY